MGNASDPIAGRPSTSSYTAPTPYLSDGAFTWTGESPAFTARCDVPQWRHDIMAFDLEAGCGPLTYGDSRTRFMFWPWASSGSELEHKLHDPASSDAISYSMRVRSPIYGFIARVAGFFLYCMFLFLTHPFLARWGVHCKLEDTESNTTQTSDMTYLTTMWSATLVATVAGMLLAHGYQSTRGARERMERVRQTAVTLAYSFLKTATLDSRVEHRREELQRLIYECLCLLTAYPVALLEQMRDNTCEPAITRYCHDTAKALVQLRNGRSTGVSERANARGGRHQFATVEYFFEIFSLQLQLEFKKQAMRTRGPSMSSQHIVYTIRNHFENLTDLGYLDDHRTPIVRENIDILSQSGRECIIFAYTDFVPRATLWSVHAAVWLMALYFPVQNCHWFGQLGPSTSVSRALANMLTLSAVSSTMLTILSEMWRVWDPFGKGTNMYGWTLGIATEIDHILNEFYEYDAETLVRKHAYMGPPSNRGPASNLDSTINDGSNCHRSHPVTA